MLFARHFEAQIHALSSYLNFSNENWAKYEQAKDEEINKKIALIRQKFADYQDLAVDEVWKRVGEREMLEYDIWNAHDNGEHLDIEFHLEPEERGLLWLDEEKNEFLRNKHFLYASFVMMCYSFIERHLIEICFHIPTEDNMQFSGIKLNGKGIHRVYQFFERTLDYKIDDSSWKELMLIRRLRNNLVHIGFDVGLQQGDDVEKLYVNGIAIPNHDLVKYLTEWKVFRFPSIVLSFEYCQHLVEFIEGLFKKLINDLSLKDRTIFM